MKTLLLLLIVSAGCFAQSAAGRSKRMADLDYFRGSWECAGKFVRSGAAIEANQSFEPILDGAFLLFRHDDKPPHQYHAWAEWGWDESGKQFVSTIQDSTGGLRIFHSSGWQGEHLVWEGGSTAQTSGQKFTFERVSPRQFRVSYAYEKDGAWTDVDSSTCTASGK